MFRAVVKKELLNHLVSFRFIVSTLIMVILAALATLIATADYNLRLRNYQSQVEEHRQDLEKIHVYSFLQPVLVRPPEPLSILDQGNDARLGNEVRIHIFAIPTTATGGFRGNELMTSFRGLDLTTIVRVVLGLLALLLSFDAVVGERENRTLQLIFSNSISRFSALAGKYLGALAALFVPLLMSFLLSLAILLWRGQVELNPSEGLRLAGIFGSYLAYLGLMVLLGLVISLFARSAPTALVVSLFAWLAIVFLIPQAATAMTRDVAGAEHAQGSTEDREAEIVRERERLLAAEAERHPLLATTSGHSSPIVETTRNKAVLRRYGSAAFYDALAAYHRQETAAGMRYAEKIFGIHQSGEADLRAEARLAAVFSYPSPAFLLDRLSESFAGTSFDDYDRFLTTCRSYRLRLIDYLRAQGAFDSWRWFTDDPTPTHPWPSLFGLGPDEVDESNVESLFGRLHEPGIAAKLQQDRMRFEQDPSRLLPIDDLPRFHHRGPSFPQAARRVAGAAAAMLALNLLLAIVAVVRFHRYSLDVAG